MKVEKNSKKNLVLEVKITETDIFKEFLNVVADMLSDDKINEDVREEYLDKLSDVLVGYELRE